jgi:hypothetical protein
MLGEKAQKNYTDNAFKLNLNQMPLVDFWIGLCSEFLALAIRAVKTLMPFATTYLCESGYSALTSMKTKYRQTECGKLFKTETLQYNIAELCASFQSHPS